MADDIMAVPEITVLGIGNVILRDEGFGVRVAEHIDALYDFPDNVQVLDGGTLGPELLRFVTGTKNLLILDAVKGSGKPGTIYTFRDSNVDKHFQDKLSAHEIGIQDVLALLDVTGRPIPHVTVMGAEPYDLEAGLELSEGLKKLVPKLTDMAIDELRSWGVDVREKKEHGRENIGKVAEESVRERIDAAM